MKGHAGAVRSVDFSSDSRHLITASDDKTAKVYMKFEHFTFLGLDNIQYLGTFIWPTFKKTVRG